MDKAFNAILDSFEIEKFQTNISLNKIVSANDKLTKTVFNLCATEYDDVIRNGRNVTVNETKIRGKKVQTIFGLRGNSKIILARPLNELDRTIFDVCNSAREVGFEGITRNSLFRVSIGGKANQYPSPNQAMAIMESLERLMTVIKIDFSNTREKMPKYNTASANLLSPILPCEILNNVVVNGQPTTLIKFTAESPLMIIARAKKQIITYPVNLRDISNQNNTPLVIMLKSYVIRRVLEIITHKMTPTITFADIFNHCTLDKATKRQQQQARKTILDIMENLKAQHIIKSFEMTKHGNAYYAVSIKY